MGGLLESLLNIFVKIFFSVSIVHHGHAVATNSTESDIGIFLNEYVF